jgi:hypothetical protein
MTAPENLELDAQNIDFTGVEVVSATQDGRVVIKTTRNESQSHW